MRFFCDCKSVARRTQKEYPQSKKNGSVLAQKSCKEILDVVKCIIVYYKQIKGTAPNQKGSCSYGHELQTSVEAAD